MRRAKVLLLALAALGAGRSAVADGDDPVVVSVGDVQLELSEVQRRMRAVPGWQLPTLGSTPAQVRKHLVDTVLVPELLLAQEAGRLELERDPVVHDRLRELLRQAMENRLRESVATESSITPAEIKSYYDQNLHRFHTPRRIKLWRILVGDEALAKKLIGEVKQAGAEAPKLWTTHARERSLDKATGMRDGNLGFVHPDGQTEAPRVRVDPALFAAADRVKDGEVVPDPVKEGDRFAVVWRRGSMEEVRRTIAQEEAAIRQVLRRKKLEDAMRDLLERARREQVRGENVALLDYVDVDAYGDVGARRRPGVVPRHSAAGAPKPKPGERGNR
jgi:peptidyl-prolyl cis-trans isomerase C